jgi:hypothetical protein
VLLGSWGTRGAGMTILVAEAVEVLLAEFGDEGGAAVP